MDGALQPALGLGGAIVIVSIAAHFIAASARSGQLSRNQAIGIRTKHTLASDEAWRAGHEAAAPMVAKAAWIGYGCVGLMAVTAIALPLPDAAPWLLVLAISGLVTVVVALYLGTSAANRAAKTLA